MSQLPKLTPNEARVIGCLMEKAVITPDAYPLTLNALTNACNQKSSRDPVTSLPQGVVQRTARDLLARQLVRIDENFKSGVEKYSHRFCNERLDEFQFDSAQYAIVCLLLLRGAQTPGELRAHSGRLHTFADNDAVVVALNRLIERDGHPIVVKLPRKPGRKDSEYMHLFFGPVDVDAHIANVTASPANEPAEEGCLAELIKRVNQLENEVAEIKERLKSS